MSFYHTVRYQLCYQHPSENNGCQAPPDILIFKESAERGKRRWVNMTLYGSMYSRTEKNPLSLRLRKYRILPEYQSTTLVTYLFSKIIELLNTFSTLMSLHLIWRRLKMKRRCIQHICLQAATLPGFALVAHSRPHDFLKSHSHAILLLLETRNFL